MTELYGIVSLGGTVVGASLNQRGLKGETGVGVTDVSFDANYDLDITYTDGEVVHATTDIGAMRTEISGWKTDAETAATNAGISETNAGNSATAAYGHKQDAETAMLNAQAAESGSANSALESEGHAVGKQNGSDVSSGSPYYHNNAKYYAGTAHIDAVDAANSQSSASGSASDASAKALVSEGYAVGKQNGTDVGSGSTYYHNNSKYYKEQASSSASSASSSASSADANALMAEGYAVGEQNGTAVSSGSPYYHNNAKYYADKASDSADAAAASAASIPSASTADPEMDGTASSGSANSFARGDHVHPTDTNIVGMIRDSLPTDTASGAIASFPDGSDLFDYLSCVADIDPIQDLSHGAPSPSNICPITGWTGCKVGVSGVNVWDEVWELGNIYSSTGQNGDSTTAIRSKNYISVKPNTQYYCKIPTTIGLRWYAQDKTYIEPQGVSTSGVVTTPNNAYYLRFVIGLTTYGNNISINYPPTDHDYHAYNGQTYTTALGRTVYGGTLDVVSGELVVDRVMVDLGSLNWTSQSTSAQKSYYSNVINDVKKPSSATSLSGAICSAYSEQIAESFISRGNGVFCISQSARINVNDNAYSDAETFKTAMNGVQLCYELATPQTYQLTPQQIATLKGQNNITATSGKVSVTYKADIQKYIDNAVGTKEEDMVANNAITSGSLFSVNDQLYKATATIAVGETITVGVNCTETSIIEELNSLITLI